MAKRPFDQINNIDQLITTSERLGGHFFDDDTMKFFNSRVLSDLYRVDDSRGYFVTSERYEDEPRTYSVRRYVVTHDDEKNSDYIDISSVDEGYQLPTSYQAKKMAKEFAAKVQNNH